jgi:hypothetical protein
MISFCVWKGREEKEKKGETERTYRRSSRVSRSVAVALFSAE